MLPIALAGSILFSAVFAENFGNMYIRSTVKPVDLKCMDSYERVGPQCFRKCAVGYISKGPMCLKKGYLIQQGKCERGHFCGKSCTCFDSDPLNCGGCGKSCDSGKWCSSGKCVDGGFTGQNTFPNDWNDLLSYAQQLAHQASLTITSPTTSVDPIAIFTATPTPTPVTSPCADQFSLYNATTDILNYKENSADFVASNLLALAAVLIVAV